MTDKIDIVGEPMTLGDFSAAFAAAKSAYDASHGDFNAAFAAFHQADTSKHEHGYTYSVELSGSAGMTLGPRDLHEADDSQEWLESLADNLKEWVGEAELDVLADSITRVDLINTECYTHGKACPDAGFEQENVYTRQPDVSIRPAGREVVRCHSRCSGHKDPEGE